MTTDVSIKDGECELVTDCILYLSFENARVVRSGEHPEGVCVRNGEVIYIEMKYMSSNPTDDLLDNIREKMSKVDIHRGKSDEGYLNNNYIQCSKFLIEQIRGGRVSFFLVVPAMFISTFYATIKGFRFLKGRFDEFCIVACGSSINKIDKNWNCINF
ncbi:hypothetical protein L3N51_01476 [Metallosphaera sp. J1]|uniref:hypothetical protein n=1 Tax=Metallosphaera TaxID=41980 RepID=UPI001EDDC3E0|nr:hypothetical protein [Metallosphaera javensis (ex Hofmann et al. 2022)]MCG3109186.1 hypothetical protein [Metallosphaera javensis (ex Hofmann et al. 2022)]BCS93340.1 MAG: hypothetical protein MjAS7_1948 [Metallosphaera javensis (ex Sakai et al. 2022)]